MKDYSSLVGIDRIDRSAICEVFAETSHALGKADLTKSLMTFLLRYIRGRAASGAT